MDKSQFCHKSELLTWVNELLELKVDKMDQCSNGAIYLQLIDTVFQDKVPFVRIKWNSTLEYEHLYNYKLLQSVFKECNIDKHIPIEKLVRGKYQDHLEFLQWIKGFVESRLDKNFKYNPQYKRVYGILKLLLFNNRQINIANVKSLLPKWAWSDSINAEYISTINNAIQMEAGVYTRNPVLPCHSSPYTQHFFTKSPLNRKQHLADDSTELHETDRSFKLDSLSTFNESVTETESVYTNKEDKAINYFNKNFQSPTNSFQHLNQLIRQQSEEITSLKKQLKESRMESQISNLSKEFYYNKLRQIEILCQKNQGKSVDTKQLLNIMYANN
ncbi:uncharacterized protein TOT_030000124 [Theileria orientalis strain Shintoku]|uniref:Uncharacterized protein n=1 Tax=Theileria orientalis strain Shintoku TaxID=869250 RepID=J4C8I8_THEOR|nr:uncharacterized protein TOT_030000124 [Theileria orientalis strain Shintoku]PVC53477.1 hypothetical protein MACL_00000059 [Theileria orientalis]BAM40863.1 uncharacterized protein TOT_030000124 [Theileria orientalis strain Shintoku]|eukprot:XP_009691164.1 uncharacterized protein TOT_030000124 [Theileria orientalis strain Shintoku]